MAHVGDELLLVLARDLEILDGLGELPRSDLYFFEEAGILDRDDCLVANVMSNSICLGVNSRTNGRVTTRTPIGVPSRRRGTPIIVQNRQVYAPLVPHKAGQQGRP